MGEGGMLSGIWDGWAEGNWVGWLKGIGEGMGGVGGARKGEWVVIGGRKSGWLRSHLGEKREDPTHQNGSWENKKDEGNDLTVPVGATDAWLATPWRPCLVSWDAVLQCEKEAHGRLHLTRWTVRMKWEKSDRDLAAEA
ncbi:hypothetical protein SESBI_20005 [Sesbania bispinosa]|nr:hypothetical protein SESBI_20005 [Sesbania bispinosa]